MADDGARGRDDIANGSAPDFAVRRPRRDGDARVSATVCSNSSRVNAKLLGPPRPSRDEHAAIKRLLGSGSINAPFTKRNAFVSRRIILPTI